MPPEDFDQENNPAAKCFTPWKAPGGPIIRRGTQAQVPLKMAIIGGGKACDDLLTLLIEEHVSPLNIEILGVSDPQFRCPRYDSCPPFVNLYHT